MASTPQSSERVANPGHPDTADTGSDSVIAPDGRAGEKVDTELGQVAPTGNSSTPDGGLEAWLCVMGAFCTNMCSFGWLNSIGVFQQYYEEGPLSSYASSTIAWIPSLQIFFMMAMGPIVGKTFDKHGPRRLLLIGSFMHVFGLMMASISKEYYQFCLSQGVCSAIGVAAIFQPAMNCINGWFNRKRGMAFGIVATGSSIGGVIWPIMVTRLINSVGYGWAMRTSAFVMLFLLVVANLTVRSRFPPNPNELSGKQLAQPFRETGFVLLTAGLFFLNFGLYIPITYIPLGASVQGMSPDLAQYLVSILNAASFFGRVISGFAADKIGRYNIFAISCFITGILILALWIPGSGNAATIAFTALFGCFSGAYVSLIVALVAQISPLREIGFRTGIVFFISSLSGLTTDPIAGAILDHTGSWIGLKVFAGVMCIVGTTLVFGTRIAHVGLNPTEIF